MGDLGDSHTSQVRHDGLLRRVHMLHSHAASTFRTDDGVTRFRVTYQNTHENMLSYMKSFRKMKTGRGGVEGEDTHRAPAACGAE